MLQDLRYALRTLGRAPAFTGSAVLAIALGIGANAAVFTVVHGVLLKPLPLPEPQRLVRISESNPEQGVSRGPVSPASFVAWRAHGRSLEHVAVYSSGRWLVAFDDTLEEVTGAVVSPAFFPMLGVSPVIGRALPVDAGQAAASAAAPEVLIGHGVWQRHFGGRPDVVGRTLSVEGRVSRTIIGVMPAGFSFPGRTEVWAVETLDGAIGPNQRQARWRETIGRLRPGVTLVETQAEMDLIAAQLTESVRPALLVLLAAVGCVLLVACANLASLMLARVTARQHELAVRKAVGASRRALMRQWLAEGLVISAAGGALGLLLAGNLTGVLIALAPAEMPRLDEIEVGGPVWSFAALLAAAVALAMAVEPLRLGRDVAVQDALKRGGRSSSRRHGFGGRAWLIAAEVALTFVLLVSAGLLLRSFVLLRSVDLGFEPRGVLSAETRLPTGRFPRPRPWVQLRQYYDRLLEELTALPGVETAGGIAGLPLTGEGAAGNMRLLGREGVDAPDDPARGVQSYVVIHIVTPGYFTAMRIPIVRGRPFDDRDRLPADALTDSAPLQPRGVAIVSEAMARRFWPGEDPIGQSVALFDHWAVESSTVVGVAKDVRQEGVAVPAEPAVYVPFGEVPGYRLSLVVRTGVPPVALAGTVVDRLRQIDPQLMVSNVRPLEDVVSGAIAGPRFNVLLVASFAVLALALAAVGIYGVVAYLVTQRTREIGIRLALGARRGDVLRLVVAQGLRPVLVGALAGAIGAVLAARAIGALLFGVAPLDPITFTSAPLVLLVVALVASAGPALRAMRVDPVTILADE